MEFRTIPGHRQYNVSECGTQVIRTVGGKQSNYLLSQTENNGYLMVSLMSKDVGFDDGVVTDFISYKNISVQRLVALAWIGPQPVDKPWVAFCDGDKTHTHRSNLKWSSVSDVIQNSFSNGRTALKGKDSPIFGRQASNATKALISESKKGKNNPNYKGCYIINGRKYYSAGEAAKETGECARTIDRWCKGGKKVDYSFVEDPEKEF